MSSLMSYVTQRALDLGLPINVHLDLTYRCNERCVHCYLDHDDRGEMTTTQIKDVLDQLAAAGTFFLVLSGGEPLLRKDFWEILEYARKLQFLVKLKTNALLIGDDEARRLRSVDVDTVQISVYSRRPEVHDAITKVKGSLDRTVAAIRRLRAADLNVTLANVLMTGNEDDFVGVQALAAELGCLYTVDPTITPHIDGDVSLLKLRIPTAKLAEVMRQPTMVGNVEEFCRPAPPAGEDVLESSPCSAGHSACYISPTGDVFPCVQFPLPTGNVLQQKFLDIWNHSPEMEDVRSIRLKDLQGCSSCGNLSSCTRCPGLAYMEGNMRGPSAADCEKSFARSGVWSANMVRKFSAIAGQLVQIRL
jgi:AdoMet-dependent heme synthase